MAPQDSAAPLLPLAASFPCPRVHAQLRDAACSYMGRSRSLESVTQGSGPASSCTVCACLRASWLALELQLPWLCTVLAHQDPNNGFIRAEPLSVCCHCSAITSRAGVAVARAFPRPQALPPLSPRWPNYEVGLVPARLWAWSPLTRQQRPNGMAGARAPRVGGFPGPWCSPGAGSGCSRGPTCAVGLLQEGRHRAWG